MKGGVSSAANPEDSVSPTDEEPTAMSTFPTPSGIFETLTGIKVPHKETLGQETDVVRLKLNAKDTQEFLFHMFEDILHDSEGMRSEPHLKMNAIFANPSLGTEKTKYTLTHFMDVFLTGMNQFYGNTAADAILWSENAMKSKPNEPMQASRATRGAIPTISWASAMSLQLPMMFYKTNPIYATIERRGMNESKHLLKSELDLKDLGKKYIHTNYTAEQIAYNNAYPLLINFDAGGDLMASILGMFSYTDISIVNVKDPGDSLRNRNKILTAIEKISNKYPTIIGSVFLEDFKKVNRIQPDSPKNAFAFIESCRGVSSENIQINNGLFIDYVVKTYASEMAKANGQLPSTKEAIRNSYTDYVKKKFKKIMRDEKYVIHNKNVRFILTGTASTATADASIDTREAELRLLDVEYYFDKDQSRMKIRFHPTETATSTSFPLHPREYDREHINSASDVGKHIHEEQSTLTNVVKSIGTGAPRTLFEFLQKTPEDAKKKIYKACMKVYLECMYKFIGDFCQILYSFYLGSIFGSFDRSAVAVAFFIMRTLTQNKEAYKLLKNYNPDDKASVERIKRGLVIATSATYHGRKAPSVSFYMNYDAMNNVETGKTIMKRFITKRMLASKTEVSRSEGVLDIERIFTLRKEYIHSQMKKYFRHLKTYFLDSDYLPEPLQTRTDSHRSEFSVQSAYKSLTKESRRLTSPTHERILLKKKKGSLFQRVQEQTRQTMKEWIEQTLNELEQTSEIQPLTLTYEMAAKRAPAAAKPAKVETVVLKGFLVQPTEVVRDLYETRLKQSNFTDKNHYLWNRLTTKIKAHNQETLESHFALLMKLTPQATQATQEALNALRLRLKELPLRLLTREQRTQYGLKLPAGEPEPMEVEVADKAVKKGTKRQKPN